MGCECFDLAEVLLHHTDDLIDRFGAGNLAGGVAAHTVGDRIEPEVVIGETRVLVVGPFEAGRSGHTM